MNNNNLTIIGVYDRGRPNLERVVLVANDYVDLGSYFLGIGMRKDGSVFEPINDNSFWLGRGFLAPNDIFHVYTGKGTPQSSKIPNQDNSIYSVHWGRSEVLFAMNELEPFLFKLEFARMRPEIETEIQNRRALPEY